MSTSKIQIVEPAAAPPAPVSNDAVAIQPITQGNYKVVSRIVDWITNERLQLLNVTERINEIVRRSGVRDGIVHLQSLHTTSAIFINEWQDALLHDVRNFFEQVVDREQYYRHNDPNFSDCERKNADSHMRGMLMGQTLSLQVRNASVLLGTWQSIIFAEFDGPRSRSLAVQVSGV
jgi:secondary thiamine-phosphate synthase enzyme